MNDEDDDIDQPEEDWTPTATDDAADPRAIKRRQKRVEIDRQNADKFWAAILADPIGRKEIWRLLQDCHAFEDRFACGPNGFPQPEATWFQAGEKAFGMRLYHSLAAIDRAGVLLMHDEHDSRFQRPGEARKKRND